jgi:hypothetical protein
MKKSYHIIFETNYLDYQDYGQRNSLHSSWNLKILNDFKFKFGGKLGNGLNHLISFDKKISEELNLKNITFAINFEEFFNAQINQKNLFYLHKNDGEIQSLSYINIECEYSNHPLKETIIQIALTPEELLNLEWEGNCNKVGGNPIWVQECEDLYCPKCKNKMDFIFQLDSGLPDLNPNNNYEIMFGNDGMLYAFWCKNDKISGYLWQST